jgi:phosphoribosylaminoimidazolecarboxamide formyltransferase/IMP cyclohydrolase
VSATQVRRALLSAADKTGIVELAQALAAQGTTLVSTGGTARTLREAGLEVQDVSAVTGHPEIMGGRVKTLHPKIHGGILARLPGDEAELAEHGIEAFDLVVVNLYRFEEAAAAGKPVPELVEQIDIGGPCMLRAAAKSFDRLAVLSDPAQYAPFLEELAQGGISAATRQRLALAAFARTRAYDTAIVTTLEQRLEGEEASEGLPASYVLAGRRQGGALRYGENPHQRGALYATGKSGLGGLELLGGGKALSYNNLLDVDAALCLAHALEAPGACVIKHAGPCGAAVGADLPAAIEAAWAGDPLSAFGSVVGLNQPLDLAAAEALVAKPFVEAIVAPQIAAEAVERIRARKGWGKNVRLVQVTPAADQVDVRTLSGAFLVQDRDAGAQGRWEVVSERAPTADEEAALRFGWTCVRFVRSNAIVLSSSTSLVGVGGGQPSRVDAVEIAARKAGERAQGAVLASDAFFPFPDGIEAAHAAGVTAVVQPGGSKKDPDVIAKANELGLAMVLTGARHFRH